MSTVFVGVTGQETLDHAQKLLGGVEGGFQKALKTAVKKAAARIRKSSVQAVRERYAISAANVRAEKNVQISYSYQSGVQAYVRFGGKRIPLYRFDGASPASPTPDRSRRVPVLGPDGWRLMHPGAAAVGHALKSTAPFRFENAFVAEMKSGHIGIFERTGGMTSGERDELDELYGPSVPQMLGSQEVSEKLSKEAMAGFEEDLDRAVQAILSGYA